MPRPSYRLASRVAALAAVGALSACANFNQLPPNTPLADVTAQFGHPNFECTLPDGVRRVIWTQQPSGQYAWGGNVSADGRVDQVVPILTDAHFEVLRTGTGTGTWTSDRILCEFGPPAEISEVGLPSVRQVVWAYRYKQSQVWNSLMYVYLGRDGNALTRFHPGPDPMYDEELPWR